MKLYALTKRLTDLLIAVPAVVVLLPVFVIIAVIIRLTSSGGALFRQERAGKEGKPFIFYKFRTMKTGIDPFGASPKSGEDVRLTKIGRFLREYSLDELPQLFNVLKGDMSIVGPRPLYISQIAEWNDRQKRRLEAKPGLTGLAQIRGRGSLTKEEKLEYDVEYVEKAGWWFDMKVIFKTLGQIFAKKNIYEKQYSRDEHTRGSG